jgi:hypothetical protein
VDPPFRGWVVVTSERIGLTKSNKIEIKPRRTELSDAMLRMLVKPSTMLQ